MSAQSQLPQVLRFGVFEIDVRAGELRKGGVKLKLQEQPFQVLCMLVAHPGEVVTREELRDRLWPADTFVDFDHGVNAAIKRLRDTLGDSPDNPRFVETLQRRGYRFIGAIDTQPNGNLNVLPITAPSPQIAGEAPIRLRSRIPWAAVSVLALGLVSTAIWLVLHKSVKPVARPTLSAFPFTSYPGLASAPRFSPDGNQVVFVWDGENGGKGQDLYVKMIGANAPRRLTNNPANWLFPDWSPDGGIIAFSRPRAGGGAEIVLISASGGAERKLVDTNADWDKASIAWSPDGKYLALADHLATVPIPCT